MGVKMKKLNKKTIIIILMIVTSVAILITSIVIKGITREKNKETAEEITTVPVTTTEEIKEKESDETKETTTETVENEELTTEKVTEKITTKIVEETVAEIVTTETITQQQKSVEEELLEEGRSLYNYYESYITEVLQKTNEIRISAGAQPLVLDIELSYCAMARAIEMSKNTISHIRPDGREWYTLLKSNNILYTTAGENIAGGQTTGADVTDAWKNSEKHYENMINPDFNKMGVGVIYAPESQYGFTWVQMFTD